jgi:Rv0078B-related antitoxin
MAISDTSPEAREIQLQIYRSMSGAQKIRLAREMSEVAREFAKARIRTEHPDWETSQVDLEWYRIIFLPNPVPAGLEDALRSR